MSSEREEPLYERVGRDDEPMSDADIERAAAAYRADHPDKSEREYQAMRDRMRRQEQARAKRAEEAAQRQEWDAAVQRLIDEAAEDGIPLDWAVADEALRRQRETAERERLASIRRRADIYAAQDARKAPPIPRPPGRKAGSRKVGREAIISKFRELRRSFGRTPTQTELAANLEPKIGLRTLQDMLTDYGLPWPIE